jgi:hypothetical protein
MLASGSCSTVPEAATFTSIICRFEDLLDRVSAAPELGSLQPKLTNVLTKGHDRAVQARDTCGAGKAKPSKQALKKVIRQAIQYAHDLSTVSAHRKLANDASLRTQLLAPAGALKADAHSLQSMLACPADAAP